MVQLLGTPAIVQNDNLEEVCEWCATRTFSKQYIFCGVSASRHSFADSMLRGLDYSVKGMATILSARQQTKSG